MASPIGGRTAFIAFSVVAHGFMVLGVDQIDAKKSHAATSIQIAESKKKPAKKPEAQVEPPPKKPEPPARESAQARRSQPRHRRRKQLPLPRPPPSRKCPISACP